MKKIFYLFILICSQALSFAQNDSQLLRDAASICATGRHEAADIALLRQGAERFAMPQLLEIATMFENKTLDVRNRQSIAATTALLAYAEQHYGKVSQEAVVCRRSASSCLLNVDWEKAHELAVENTRCAGDLSKKNAKNKEFHLLNLTVQLEQISIEKWHDEDNPNHWELLYKIEKELEPYFKGDIVYTEELVDACQYMANLQTYQTAYFTYVDWLMTQYFPDEFYLEGRTYNNDLFSNMEQFMLHAFEGAKTLWGENDLRTLSIEIELLTMQIRYQLAEYDTLHHRLREIQAFVKDYMPRGDFAADRLELLIWECNINYGKNLEEIGSPYLIQSSCKACYGENSEAYLSIVSQLANLIMMVDMSRGRLLLNEAERVMNAVCLPHTDLYDTYMLYLTASRQTLASENPEEFQRYFTQCVDYYKQHHRLSWESVYMGKTLAYIFNSSLLLYDNAADLLQIALEDIAQLTGKQSLVYASTLFEQIDYLRQSQDKMRQQQAIGYCKEAIEIYEQLDVSSAQLYRMLSDSQFFLGQQDDAAQTLREGIAKCTKPKEGMWRCLMQIILAQNLLLNTEHTDEAQALFEEAIPFFNAHIEETGGAYMEGYYQISDYYRVTHQYEKAEEILKRGMAHYDALYGVYDGIYMRMLSDLYGLYADDMNNLDMAEQVLEGRLEAIKQNPAFSLHNVVLELLWNRYRLLSRKTNDWMLLGAALNDIFAQTNKMGTLAGKDNVYQLEDLFLSVFYEWANLCPMLGQLLKDIRQSIDSHSEEFTKEQITAIAQMSTGLNDMIINQAIPFLQEKEKRLKEYESYLENRNTLDLYIALANIYIGFAQDTLKAESYYRELLNSNIYKYRAVSELAYLKIMQQKYDEAIVLYKQQKELAEQNPWAMVSIQDKANYYGSLSYAYTMCGKYHDAIAPARDFFSLRQQLAAQNFYLLTQTERENFIHNGALGGDGIWFLLPKFPQELSKDSYDAMLATKGLLLRASDNIKRAVMQSGNQELVAQMDSLNLLNAQYKTMNTQTDWVHGNNNYDPETVALRQQIEALERAINRQATQFVEGMDAPDWKKLQSVLKPGEATIEYVLSDSASCGALVLFPQGEPMYVPLAPSMELWKEMEKLRNLDAKRKAEILYQEDRLELYDRLWKPLEDKLKDVKVVYYSPTSFLNDLAYAAFKCADGSYLADHYELHQMLSTGDLVALREKDDKNAVQTASLYGAVFYSPEHQDLALKINSGMAIRGMEHDERGAIADESEAFGYLSYTQQEIEQVGKILEDNHVSTTHLTGFEPTEEAFRDINKQSPHILHVSTHGFFVQNDISNLFLKRFPSTRFSSMQRSGLALVDANRTWEGATDKPEDKDGIITANEVAQLDLSNTRLAVLSACQTAVGEHSIEGVYGMHRGFKQAGVKSILATLWNVNDKSTARFMELFYQRWLSGTPMQQSLHEAVTELRKEYPSPFYWAPFVLMDAEN